MKKIFYVSSCSTCKRIIADLGINDRNFYMQDIKNNPLSIDQLELFKSIAGSYEAVFSRIAMKYRQLGLNERRLTEKDYKAFILEEYTFLRRPVIIIGKQIFIGSSKNNIEKVRQAMAKP